MKKIIGLTLAAVMVMTLVGVGTWAFFSDTEASNDNTWTAGTLNLVNVISGTGTVTEQADGSNDKVVFGSVEPGSSGTITWTLTNDGSTDGTLTLVAATSFSEGTDTEPELALATAGLDTKLMVCPTVDGLEMIAGTVLATPSTWVAMSGLAAALNLEVDVTMDAAAVIVYVLNWEVPTTVGNEIQGDTAELDITFTLTQS